MNHAFMVSVAEGLLKRDVATLRYQFLYFERGDKRPDRPEVAHVTVRSAVTAANKKFGKIPVIAGGKSFGGRMTSQAQAISPMAGVVGLVFFGFPLHPAGKPSIDRAEQLRSTRPRYALVRNNKSEVVRNADKALDLKARAGIR